LGRTLVATVAQHHAAAPDSAGLPLDAARRALATHDWLAEATLEGERAGGRLEMVDGALRTPGFRRTASVDPGLVARVEARVVAAGLQPPSWPELVTEFGASAEQALREAIRSGRLVAVERDRSYAPEVLARFETLVREQGAAGAITPASLRERTGMSRKFLIPLLEWCDRRGVTRREGDARVLLRNPGGRAAPA
jgi:selenocysteine-specific elongation factor